MQLHLSLHALYITWLLNKAGFEAYVVGGAVRDILLHAIQKGSSDPATITDYDFTTNATPDQIQALFPESFYENAFGTVSVTWEHLSEQMVKDFGFKLETLQPPSLTKTTPKNRLIDLAQATKLHESLQTTTKKDGTTQHSDSESSLNLTADYKKFEITTFRSDGVYEDFRRPTTVNWGHTIQEDLDRRDFTINALALVFEPTAVKELLTAAVSNPSPSLEVPASAYKLIDLHQGQQDLEAGTIRTVGDPQVRFNEDALRMLRAIRFSVQLNMGIEDATFAAIQAKSALIEYVSGERIRDELLKMLSSNYPAEAIELLDQSGLLPYILPELLEGKGVQQGGHHTTNVWTHSLDALRNCPSSDAIVRLATLLHDIAKPQTQGFTPTTITFYNHEIVGARVAKNIGYRLRLSKKECERLFTLVRYHMFYYQPENTDAAIRRFMRKVGLENIDDILDLREADRLGSGARKTSWRLEEMKQRMIEQLNQPMAVKDLAIDGHDLMNEFKLKPGPILGDVLNYLFEKVLDAPELNIREKLLEMSKEYLEGKQKEAS